ncbi:MAG: DUF3108 domain-containing protein [Pseudomonadota bacterium]
MRRHTWFKAGLLGLALALPGPPTAPSAGANAGANAGASAIDVAPLTGTFSLSVGGVTAAELVFDGAYAGGEYRVAARIATKGLIGRLFSYNADAEVEGAARTPIAAMPREPDARAGLAPRRFRSESRWQSNARLIEMSYAGAVPRLSIEPAYDEAPWALDPRTQTDALDPLSGALTAFGDRPAGALCDREVRIYDARRRFQVTLGPPSRPSAGGVITCEAEYRRLAGFKPRLLAKPPTPFRVEFAPGPQDLWRFQRAVAKTPYGTAVIARQE